MVFHGKAIIQLVPKKCPEDRSTGSSFVVPALRKRDGCDLRVFSVLQRNYGIRFKI